MLLRRMRIEELSTPDRLKEFARRLRAALVDPDFLKIYTFDPHQFEILHLIADAFDRGEMVPLVKAVGAAGKTRIMIAVAMAIDAKTIMKFPTHTALNNFFEELDKLKIPREIFGQYHKSSKVYDKTITLTVNNSHPNGHRRGHFMPDSIMMIMSDEGHHQMSKGQKAVNKAFSNVPHMAFTATDTRDAERTLRTDFNLVVDFDYVAARKRDAVAPFDNYVYFTKGFNISGVETTGGELNAYQLAEKLDKPERYAQIALLLEWRNPKTGRRIIDDRSLYFAGLTTEIEHLKDYLNVYFEKFAKSEGLSSFASSYHSKNTTDENNANKKNLEANECRLLMGVTSLGESFNIDEIVNVVAGSPSTSTLKVAQRVYRGTRKNRNDPNKRMGYYDILDEDQKARAITGVQAIYGDTYFPRADRLDELSDNPIVDAVKAHFKIRKEDNSGPQVISVDEMVATWAKKARAEKHKRKIEADQIQEQLSVEARANDIALQRKQIFNDPIAAPIREAMYEKGYLNVRQLYQAAQKKFGTDKESFTSLNFIDDAKVHDISYHKLMFVMRSDIKGLDAVYRKRDLIPELMAIKELLGIDLDWRFSDTPEDKALWTEQDRLARENAEKYLTPGHEEQRQKLRKKLDKIHDAKYDFEFILPNINREVKRTGLQNFREVFSAAQVEFGFKALSPEIMCDIMMGMKGIISLGSGVMSMGLLRREALALCILFQNSPPSFLPSNNILNC